MLFGASGATGSQVMQQALEQSVEVMAVVRSTKNFDIKNSNLQMAEANLMDSLQLEALMFEFKPDAVCITLGASPTEKEMIRAEITQSIISAMQSQQIQRIVCMTTLGMGKTIDMLPLQMRRIIIPMFLKNAFKDHELQEKEITSTDLDWTIVRPANLTNGKKTGAYQYGSEVDKNITGKISRADVADFMLKCLNNPESIHQKLWISY